MAEGTGRLTDLERAAILIVSLESETTGITKGIVTNMQQDKVRRLLKSVSELGKIGSDKVQTIMDEFYALAIEHQVIFGGKSMTSKILKDAYGIDEQDHFFSDKHDKFGFLNTVSDEELLSYFKTENKQMITMILSRINDDKAAKIISQMDKEKASYIVKSFLTIKEPNVHFLWKIQQFLEDKFVEAPETEGTDSDENLFKLGRILERTRPSMRNYVFKDLEKASPKKVELLKSLIFTFSDLEIISERDFQTILYEVDPLRVLAEALTGSSDELSQKVLDNVSDRVKVMLEEEISNVKDKVSVEVVEESQNIIVDLARKLEADEKIEKLESRASKEGVLKEGGGEEGASAPEAAEEKEADSSEDKKEG